MSLISKAKKELAKAKEADEDMIDTGGYDRASAIAQVAIAEQLERIADAVCDKLGRKGKAKAKKTS